MGCSMNGAMQGPGMVHGPRGRMCAAEGLHYWAAWRHGTAQRLPEFTSRAARARHEVTSESLTYKFIAYCLRLHFFRLSSSCVMRTTICGCSIFRRLCSSS